MTYVNSAKYMPVANASIIAVCLAALLITGCATGVPHHLSDFVTIQKLQSKAMLLSLAWSPDGKWLATAGSGRMTLQGPNRNNTVRVWDTATGKLKWSMEAHAGEILDGSVIPITTSVAWQPGGKYLASSGPETIKIWNVSARADEHVLRDSDGKKHHPMVVSWSNDGGYLASGFSDGDIVIWKVESEEKVFTLKGHSAGITSAVWSPDGNRLASSSYDKTVRLWDVVTGSQIREFTGHKGFVQAVDWSPDGKRLVSGSNDGTVRFWSVETGKEELSIATHAKPGGSKSPFPSIVTSLSWSIDGSTIAFGATDGTVRLIDVNTKTIKDILRGNYGEVLAVSWSPDGTRLASCDFNGQIIIWEKRN